MKKFKDRYLRKLSHVFDVAYLFTAIIWGIATFSFQNDRADLKEEYNLGEISKEEYLDESMKFSQKEEDFFKGLFVSLSTITVADLAFQFATKDKDY